MMNEQLEKNYSRNCVMRTNNLIIKEAYYKGSLQRYEFYYYKNSPIPYRSVFVQMDGKVVIE